MAFWGTGLVIILIAIVPVVVILVVARYRRDIRAARKRIQSLGSQVVETNLGPVEFVQVGEGYPILVVHGAMGGFDQGLFLAQNVDLPHIQVLSVSRFGYLRSPIIKGATLDTQADVFAALLDVLGIRQAVVFAVSAGTTSAIRFAARHPERISALILLGPDAPGETYMALPPRFVFDTLFRSDLFYWVLVTFFGKKMRTASGLVPTGFALTPENAALVDRVQAGDLPISGRMDGMIFETYTCKDEFKASVTSASPYPLNRILTPTLVINALDDPISIPENVSRLAQQLVNARQFIVPNGGHLFFGHIEEVRAEIAQFLLAVVTELQGDLREMVVTGAGRE